MSKLEFEFLSKFLDTPYPANLACKTINIVINRSGPDPKVHDL
jgi:hypothetical protein